MSRPKPRRCSQRTKSGRPCQAWAVRGSDPPACAAHGGLPQDRAAHGRQPHAGAAHRDTSCKADSQPNRPSSGSLHLGQHERPAEDLLPSALDTADPGILSKLLNPVDLTALLTRVGSTALDDEIACARSALRRVVAALSEPGLASENPQLFARLAGLAFQGTRTIAHLLRDERALAPGSDDAFAQAVGQALDELGAEWEVEL